MSATMSTDLVVPEATAIPPAGAKVSVPEAKALVSSAVSPASMTPSLSRSLIKRTDVISESADVPISSTLIELTVIPSRPVRPGLSDPESYPSCSDRWSNSPVRRGSLLRRRWTRQWFVDSTSAAWYLSDDISGGCYRCRIGKLGPDGRANGSRRCDRIQYQDLSWGTVTNIKGERANVAEPDANDWDVPNWVSPAVKVFDHPHRCRV